MFRPSDVRRVQAAFDEGIEPPFEAQIQLENERRTMRVVIMDPDDETLPVGQAIWWFDDGAPKTRKQPDPAEVLLICEQLNRVCAEYPARKEIEAIEKAAREAMQAANMAARRADAEAQRALEAPREE